ncbi:MAG: sugar kinase [Gammaproteobacteria bacterium]|nr:sugar kinase [Gammaproteobacteria bacterium]
MTRILVAGVAVVDMVFRVDEMPRKADKYRALDAIIVGGGCAANAAVAISRLGGDAALISRLGGDAIADLILNELRDEKVALNYIHRAREGKSSYSSIYVDEEGERQIMNFRGSGLIQHANWLDEGIKADAILADNRWPEMTEKMMRMARLQDIPGIIDAEQPVTLNSLQDASHIAFSRQGLVTLTGEDDLSIALKAAAKKLSAWLCVTDGPHGVYFLHQNMVENIPGFDIEVVDTLAAGDIWHGAFALRIAEGASETAAIEFANAAAAIKCMHYGGRAGCPNRNSTNNFLKENK